MLFREESNKYLYHYTSLSTALEKILFTGNIQFSPLRRTNDPRESKYWHMGGFLSRAFDNKRNPLELVINTYRLNFCKVLCLSADDYDKSATGNIDRFWIKGYQHPRMWAQYADNHHGVCLLFEIDELINEVNRHFADKKLQVFHGRVKYTDDPSIFIKASMMEDTENEDVNAKAREHICTYNETLFLTKNYDWKSENEYRFILVGNDENYEYLPIENSLKGLILGCDFPKCYLPVVDNYSSKYDIKIGEISWNHGHPFVSEIQKPQIREAISLWLREESKKGTRKN